MRGATGPIDYMDGTVTRVVPEYIKSMGDVGPVGAFRRVIRDVEIDLEGQLVKVVLGEAFAANQSAKLPGSHPGLQALLYVRTSKADTRGLDGSTFRQTRSKRARKSLRGRCQRPTELR